MTTSLNCSLCGGPNLPHENDEYHQFLRALKFADSYLQNAKEIADKGLPSIQIQLKHTLDSITNLRKEAIRI